MIGIKKKRKLIRSVLIYGICIFEDGFHAEKVKESLYKGVLIKRYMLIRRRNWSRKATTVASVELDD